MNTITKKIIKLAVIGTVSLILVLALADRTNRHDLGMWSGLWWPQYDPQNPHEIYGTYPVKLQYHAGKRRPGSGWDSETISHTKAHIEKGGIQLNNQYQGIWNNYVDVHNTTWKYYVLEI